MFYSLKQRLFFVLKFHRLDHSISEAKQSFQRKFNATKEQKKGTIEVPFEIFQRTGNLDDDLMRPRATVTDTSVYVVQQVIQQRSGVSIQRVSAQTGLRRIHKHRIMHHSLPLFTYKIQTRQLLVLLPFKVSEMFANTMLQQLDVGEIGEETFVSPMMLTSSLTTSSINRTGAIGERKISMLNYHHP